MVCASVQALASGLSQYGRTNHTITFLLHKHTFLLCALRDILSEEVEYHLSAAFVLCALRSSGMLTYKHAIARYFRLNNGISLTRMHLYFVHCEIF